MVRTFVGAFLGPILFAFSDFSVALSVDVTDVEGRARVVLRRDLLVCVAGVVVVVVVVGGFVEPASFSYQSLLLVASSVTAIDAFVSAANSSARSCSSRRWFPVAFVVAAMPAVLRRLMWRRVSSASLAESDEVSEEAERFIVVVGGGERRLRIWEGGGLRFLKRVAAGGGVVIGSAVEAIVCVV